MKKIIPVLLILGLVTIVLIQYFKLSALHPEENYQYQLREDIDLDYFQPIVLGAYYQSAQEVGLFARNAWKSEGINVRFPDVDSKTEQATARKFGTLIAYADSLGARLARSQSLKTRGFNNAEIQRITEAGISQTQIEIERNFGSTLLQEGDQSTGVLQLQKLLLSSGYQIPQDGNFRAQTAYALRDYQLKKNLLVTGNADLSTLLDLMNK